MKRQENISQETSKISRKQQQQQTIITTITKETKISNFPGKEFKEMVIRTVTKLKSGI